MEILLNQSNTIIYYGEAGWTVTAVWKKNGVEQGSLTVTSDSGKYSVTLPYMIEEAEVEIIWTLTIPSSGTLTYKQEIKVVTPILPIHVVKQILNITDNVEAIAAEAATRHIINAHCGQEFGRYVGTKFVTGRGGTTILLPVHLESLTSVNGLTDVTYWEIVSGGWGLKQYTWSAPPIKADFHGLHMHTGGVIHNPNRVSVNNFVYNRTWEVNGVWGYNSVPAAVQEAAKLLLKMYADCDTEYRDRYLTSMTAADWRIQFNNGAFTRTGHARADQLLEPHVLRRGWAVL